MCFGQIYYQLLGGGDFLAKETIDTVKSAEEQAISIKQEAVLKAENIISDAKAAAADILNSAKSKANSDNLSANKQSRN